MSECDREASIMMRPRPIGECCAMKRRKNVLNNDFVNVNTLNNSQQFKLKPRREYLLNYFVAVWMWSAELSVLYGHCRYQPATSHAMMLISELRGRGWSINSPSVNGNVKGV